MRKIFTVLVLLFIVLGFGCKEKDEEPDDGDISDITVSGYIDNSSKYSYTKATFPIGENIFHPADWSRANIFTDLIKQVEFFGTADQPWVKGIKTDENSWPLEDFGVILFRDSYSIGNVGTYKISFYCSVIPDITTNASDGIISNVKRDETTGKVTADLTTEKNKTSFF